MRINPILQTDSYKISHWKQYPKGTQYVHSYFEARTGGKWDRVLFVAALNYYIRQIAETSVEWEDLEEAERFCSQHLNDQTIFNRKGWERILQKHGGRLPVRIRAVPEGLLVPVSNVLLTVENEDPELPWLTNYLETRLSQMWYPITVATQSFYARQTILGWLEQTGDPSTVDFKLHDFGYRGVSSLETAMIGGFAHLVSFKGTDTMPPLAFAQQYYNELMAGFSIPAAEHSTITSWGREHEVDAFRNMLTQYPAGLVAVVSDSYDIRAACEHLWGEVLRDEVLGRAGTVIIRPDSGDPVKMVPEVLNILGSKFPTTVNAKGYRVLDPHVRVIQGDGINPPVETIDHILAACAERGWSADNVAFGSGGGLLQNVNRDTLRFAFKCSAICIDGHWHNVSKAPATDLTKSSKGGRLSLYWNTAANDLQTRQYTGPTGEVLQTVYEKYTVQNLASLETIRERRRFADARESRQRRTLPVKA